LISVAFCRAALVRKSVPEKRETAKSGKNLSAASPAEDGPTQPRTRIAGNARAAQATEQENDENRVMKKEKGHDS
jgi:hypothetical protein